VRNKFFLITPLLLIASHGELRVWDLNLPGKAPRQVAKKADGSTARWAPRGDVFCVEDPVTHSPHVGRIRFEPARAAR